MKLLKISDNEYTLHYSWANRPDVQFVSSVEKLSDFFMFLGGNLNELEKGLLEMIRKDHNICYFHDFTKVFETTEKAE